MKPTAYIEDWVVVNSPIGRHLMGHITKHPRQGEFKKRVQVTSPVIRFDFVAGLAETENTLYRLVRR